MLENVYNKKTENENDKKTQNQQRNIFEPNKPKKKKTKWNEEKRPEKMGIYNIIATLTKNNNNND